VVAKKVKPPYRHDQRELSLLVYATRDGRTRAVMVWRECLAGEDSKREWELGRWEWPAPVSTKEHALWCVVQIAKGLTVTRNIKQ
jgi:hypothetical protein